VTNYYYSVYIKYLTMNTQEATIPSGNCTPGRQSDSDRCLAAIAWASCYLFSVEQCLAAFAWASCYVLFIITSGTSESRFHNFYLITFTIFSV